MITRTCLVIVLLLRCAAAQDAAAPQGRRLLPADATLPARAPSVAVGADGACVLVFASGDEIRCTRSLDGGVSFGEPVRVGAAGALAAGPTRGPRAALTSDVLVVLTVCGGQQGDLLAWRSTDRGANWKGPVRVNDVHGSANEGLHAVAAAPDGSLLAVWLDHRGQGAELWGDWSDDGGATWSGDERLYASPDGSVCECCAPSVAFDPSSGRAILMWRNHLGGDRDLWTLALRRGESAAARTPRAAGTGHWTLDACPMAGGGLAVSRRGELLTFWRRESELYLSAPGLPETDLGAGRESAAAAGPDGFELVWTNGDGHVLAARAVGLGAAPASRELGRGLNVSVGGAPDGRGPVLAAWETGTGAADGLRYELLAARAGGT